MNVVAGALAIAVGVSALVSGIRPVSYTHLDVYKRQDYEKEVLGKVIRAAWDSGTVPLETIEKYRGLDLPWRVRHGAAGGVQHLPDPAGSEFYG